jgi:hypothetical protein
VLSNSPTTPNLAKKYFQRKNSNVKEDKREHDLKSSATLIIFSRGFLRRQKSFSNRLIHFF